MHKVNEGMAQYRERKKERTRANLSDAAVNLFLAYGFEETTVEQIATSVGVGRRTFFHYFPTKYDVLFSWYDDFRERISATLLARPKGEGALSAAIATLQGSVDVYNDRVRIVSIIARLGEESPAIRARQMQSRLALQHELADALAARLGVQADLAAKLIAAVVMTASSAAVDVWIADGLQRPLAAYSKAHFAKTLRLFSGIDAQFALK